MKIPARRDVKKIAVLRANAVGDFVVALPALEALRAFYPKAEIVLLGRHWHASFLENRPGPVDRTVVVPFTRGVYDPPEGRNQDPEGCNAFFGAMTDEQFDLAFQLHGGGKNSNPFVRGLGARFTIGAKTADAVPLDRWVPYRSYQNETLRLLEIVSLCGAKPAGLVPRLMLTEKDRDEAERTLPDDGRPLAVINPGCRDPRRRWPPAKFAAIADVLAGNGAKIVLHGDSGDESSVRETLYRMRERPVVCDALSLGGLAALLSRSRLIVSNDTGPLHLACAVGTAGVGIYWCGNVMVYAPTLRRRNAVHVSWRTDCPVCGANCFHPGCTHLDSFVSDITTEEVAASALELFGMEGAPA